MLIKTKWSINFWLESIKRRMAWCPSFLWVLSFRAFGICYCFSHSLWASSPRVSLSREFTREPLAKVDGSARGGERNPFLPPLLPRRSLACSLAARFTRDNWTACSQASFLGHWCAGWLRHFSFCSFSLFAHKLIQWSNNLLHHI